MSQIKNPRINSKLKRHNIVPYFFEQEELIEASNDHGSKEEAPQEMKRIKVSKLYKKRPLIVNQVPARRGNSQDETQETYTWNIIRHVTMQSTHGMNLVANTLVQVAYSLSPIRSIVLRHICTEDSCITCELHFLFTAFSSKIGDNSGMLTNNLAWALARNGVSLKAGGVLSATQQIIKTVIDDVARTGIFEHKTISNVFCSNFVVQMLRVQFAQSSIVISDVFVVGDSSSKNLSRIIFSN